MPQGNTIRGLLAAAIISLTAAGVHAETFPTKPVRLLVPYAAGGAVDEAVKWEPVLKEANIKVQ